MIMPGAGGTDRQLLDHFVRDQDPGAFRSLVSRHGAAVHGVCRSVLRDPHEAEDAFQATFLVLARKAAVIRDPDSLGAWLRGVAYRVAVRARRRAARRRALEKTWAEMARDQQLVLPAELTPELPTILRDELERLPESYRQPIELCYLAGLTHQEAARRLDWPVGTVKVRLVRGRRLLRERLDRRGVALGAGVLLILPEVRGASAVSEALVEATVRALTSATAGRRAASKFLGARALERAASASGLAIAVGIPWLWIALALAGLSLGLSAPVALAWSAPPAPEVDAASLPGNLTDILNVQCR
jgi:RNA polymerase sigma-70 factor (ECF subfamily)